MDEGEVLDLWKIEEGLDCNVGVPFDDCMCVVDGNATVESCVECGVVFRGRNSMIPIPMYVFWLVGAFVVPSVPNWYEEDSVSFEGGLFGLLPETGVEAPAAVDDPLFDEVEKP